MADQIRKRRTGERGLGSKTSRVSHRSSGSSHRGRGHRYKSGKQVKYGGAVLLFGICAVLLLWLIPRRKPGVEVVPWDTLAYGQDELGARGMRYSSFVNDSEYMFVISSDDLPESKGFGITKPAALTASEAAVLARDSLGQYISESDLPEWHLTDVSLHRCTEIKWYYTVGFRPKAGGANSDGTAWQLRIPVLMNGDVVNGIARQNIRDRKKDLEIAAKSLGVTTEELIVRRKESAAALQDNHDVTLISHVDTKVFKFEIASRVLSELGDYDPMQPLPLATHDAAEAALKVCNLYLPAGQRARWQIEELSLNRWGSSSKWYYLVAFRLKGGADGIIVPQLLIPVLLNGQTIQGQPLQRREK